MIILALFAASFVLFFGFLALTAIEAKRGARFLAPVRSSLDAKVSRAAGALKHVDFSAFLWHLGKDVGGRLIHDVAHILLIVVRSVERFLTRIVKYLRAKVHAPTATPPEGRTSAFIETISYFKKTLRRSKETPKQEEVE